MKNYFLDVNTTNCKMDLKGLSQINVERTLQ